MPKRVRNWPDAKDPRRPMFGIRLNGAAYPMPWRHAVEFIDRTATGAVLPRCRLTEASLSLGSYLNGVVWNEVDFLETYRYTIIFEMLGFPSDVLLDGHPTRRVILTVSSRDVVTDEVRQVGTEQLIAFPTQVITCNDFPDWPTWGYRTVQIHPLKWDDLPGVLPVCAE